MLFLLLKIGIMGLKDIYEVYCNHRADIGSVAWAGTTSGGFYWA